MSVWQTIEKQIGAEKLFPSLSYANLDLDSLLVSMQSLDAMMSLVSPGKSNRAAISTSTDISLQESTIRFLSKIVALERFLHCDLLLYIISAISLII